MVYPHLGVEFISLIPGRRWRMLVPGACGTLGQNERGMYVLPQATSNLPRRGRGCLESWVWKAQSGFRFVNNEKGKETSMRRRDSKSSQVSWSQRSVEHKRQQIEEGVWGRLEARGLEIAIMNMLCFRQRKESQVMLLRTCSCNVIPGQLPAPQYFFSLEF